MCVVAVGAARRCVAACQRQCEPDDAVEERVAALAARQRTHVPGVDCPEALDLSGAGAALLTSLRCATRRAAPRLAEVRPLNTL
jgi:hypothetical protein